MTDPDDTDLTEDQIDQMMEDATPLTVICELPHQTIAEEDACEQANLRRAVSAKLWQVAEQTIIAEWICCEPLDPTHTLCAKGYSTLRMVRALLVDDPEAWRPAPLLDAVMGLLPQPAVQAECSASISGHCLRESQSETACDTEAGECVHGGRPGGEELPPGHCAAAIMGRPHAPHSWQAEPGAMMVRCDGLVT